MAMEQDVIDFLKSLFTSSATRHAVASNPAATFEARGVADATPQQWQAAATTLAFAEPGALPPEVQSSLQSTLNTQAVFSDAISRTAPPPPTLSDVRPDLAENIQRVAALTTNTVYAPTFTTNTTSVQNTDDHSVVQNLTNLGGTLINDNVSATDHSVAGGLGSDVTGNTGDGSTVLGSGTTLDNSQLNPTQSTLVGEGATTGSISGGDRVVGGAGPTITDAGVTGTSFGSPGSTNIGATQGGLAAAGPVQVESPGAAQAGDGGAASGGGAPGGTGGQAGTGGAINQAGGDAAAATGASAVQTGSGEAGTQGAQLASDGGSNQQVDHSTGVQQATGQGETTQLLHPGEFGTGAPEPAHAPQPLPGESFSAGAGQLVTDQPVDSSGGPHMPDPQTLSDIPTDVPADHQMMPDPGQGLSTEHQSYGTEHPEQA